jgi:hypothetical protein
MDLPPWIERMTEAEAKARVLKDVDQYNRMRSRAERAEHVLASVRTIFPMLHRAVYGLPEPDYDEDK